MADYTGAQAVNFQLVDGDRFTGNVTVNNGVVMSGTAGANVAVTGNYTCTVDGGLNFDFTQLNPMTFQSSSTTPYHLSWTGFVFNALDTGSKWNGIIIKDARFAWYCSSSYTTDTLESDQVIAENCGTGFAYLGTATSTWGDFEVRFSGANNNDVVIEPVRFEHSGNLTIDSLYLHHIVRTSQAGINFTSTGTTTITKLVIENVMTGTALGTINRESGTPVVNITKIWAFGFAYRTADYLFYNFSSGTLNVDGGIVMWGYIISASLNTNVTFDNVDAYMFGHEGWIQHGNWVNCFFGGGSHSGNSQGHDMFRTVWQPANTGTANGVAEYTSNPFYNLDSVSGAKATPNYPYTFAVDLAASSVTDDDATLACTPNCPGILYLLFDTTARTVNAETGLWQYRNRIAISHYEWQDYSGNGEVRDSVASRSRTFLNDFEPSTTYKARAAILTPWGKWYWGSETNFTTSAAAAAGGGLKLAGVGGLAG